MDERVITAWHANAAPWTDAVRERRIASRRLVTDAAVVDAVLRHAPRTVLDLGCGEGWLARALAARGVRVTGVDVVPALVERARQGGGGTFHVASYEAIAAGAHDATLGAPFDVAVANFALIGHEAVDALLAAAPRLLVPGGTLVIQTLHPLVACGDAPYADGWRAGSWDGFGPEFREAPPWYFRTLATWVATLTAARLTLHALREPLHPETGRPASVILEACSAGPGRAAGLS